MAIPWGQASVLGGKVGHKYSFNANSHQIRQEVSPDVQALQASQVISKKIELAYGEVVHLPLTYGVDVAVCAQKHNAAEIMSDRSECQGY